MTQKTSNATLLHVARAADVSRSTVSNVFSHPSRVRAEVIEKVRSVASSLGYSGPDPRGRLLRAGKVHAVGIIPPGTWGIADSLKNPVFFQQLLGISEVCDEVGASVLIIPDKKGSGGVQSALVDSFIFSRFDQLAEIESARLRRLPYVVLDADPGPDVNSVRVNARAGCHAAVRHLLDLGHRRFGIVSFLREFGPPHFHPPGRPRRPEDVGMEIDQEKLRGYADALAEEGISIDDVPMVQAHPWERDAARMILDHAPGATAIVSMSAMQGIRVIEEAWLRGLVVPRDLSVVGYNDIPEAALCNPPLTTIDSMGTEKGRMAARIVLEPGAIQKKVIETRLVMRASTARVPS